MRKGNPWAFAAALLLAVAAVALVEHHYSHPRMLRTGDRLTPLSLSGLDGRPVTFAPAGRPELINVFATWCPPCREETPQLAAAAKTFLARGVTVVGIDQQEGAAQVAAFARQFSLPYPVYIDAGGITHWVLGARVIPETVFVDGNGTIRWIHEGPLSSSDLQSIARALKSAG